MRCRERLESYLREQRVPYHLHFHSAAMTAQEVAEREHVPGRMLAKVVLVQGSGGLAMVVVAAPRLVDLDLVAAALGDEHLRLAREEDFAVAFPDCDAGAMPAFGNLYGLPVLVDAELAGNDAIVMQAGTHTDTVTVPYADFERLVQPVVGAFSRELQPA